MKGKGGDRDGGGAKKRDVVDRKKRREAQQLWIEGREGDSDAASASRPTCYLSI